jgi:hypothetical protein
LANTESTGPLRPVANHANERIARQIVDRIVQFKTPVPCGLTWHPFATAQILLALNCGLAHGKTAWSASSRLPSAVVLTALAVAVKGLDLDDPEQRRRWEAGGTI